MARNYTIGSILMAVFLVVLFIACYSTIWWLIVPLLGLFIVAMAFYYFAEQERMRRADSKRKPAAPAKPKVVTETETILYDEETGEVFDTPEPEYVPRKKKPYFDEKTTVRFR